MEAHVKVLVLGLVSAVLALAGHASAADLFGDFNNDCLKTHGDQKAALAAADAAGWTAVDKTKSAPTLSPNFKLTEYEARTNGKTPDARVLVVGSGTMTTGAQAMPAQMCMVVGAPLGDGLAQMKARLGMEPTMTMAMPGAAAGATMTMYIYRDAASGPTALTPDQLAAFGGAGSGQKEPVTMVMAIDLGTSSAGMLGHIVLKP
jgi:hypothetical protein